MVFLDEPIDVYVYFKLNKFNPHIFLWRGRKIKVDQVNLVHTSKDGANLFYFFSISSGGNFYRLKFDITKLKWFLEAVEEGG